jgi:hypothetical protein
MGHHAAKLGSARSMEDPADLDEAPTVVRRDSGAAAVRIDLDQHRKDRGERLGLDRRGLGHLDAVEDMA